MSYTFAPAANVMAIKEQEFGSSGEVRFTTFTSCIGLLGRRGDTVTGVHLVMFSSDDTQFNQAAAAEAVALLGSFEKVVVIGHTGIWSGAGGEISAAYGAMLEMLGNPVVIPVDDGIYGGRVAGGVFQTYQNGVYYNVP